MSTVNLFPHDWITIIYLAVSSGLMLIFHKNLARWYLYAAVHVTVILAILSLHFAPNPLPTVFQLLRDWYALTTILLFYWEVAPLTRMVFQKLFDNEIVQWENRLFLSQPSTDLSKRFSSIVLSEYLHLCYLSYYAISIALAATLYFQGKYEAFYKTLFAELLTFNVCLICYIFMPVAGPRYDFEKLKGGLSGGNFFRLTHAILARASSKGTAFPSSHAAISTIVLLCSARYDLTSFLILFPFCTGLIIGTVYGRFHYAIDAIAGTLLGILMFALYPIGYQWLSGG